MKMSVQNRRLWIGVVLLSTWILLCGSAPAAEKKAAPPGAGRGIAVESLPRAVQATVKEQTQGAVIRNISKEVMDGKSVYEVETKVGAHSRDMIVGTDGKLLIVETQVVLDSLP